MIIRILRLVSYINYHHYFVQKILEGILAKCDHSMWFNYNFVLWFSEQFPRYSYLDVYCVFRVSDLIKRAYGL